MTRVGLEEILALYAEDASGLPAGVRVIHTNGAGRLAGLFPSHSTVTTATTVAGSALAKNFIALFATGFGTLTVQCFAHKAFLCCHSCILHGTTGHEHGSKSAKPALVVYCVRISRLDEWCYLKEELVVSEQPIAKRFDCYAGFEVLFHVLFNRLAKHGGPDLVNDDLFHGVVYHSTDSRLNSKTVRVVAQKRCSTGSLSTFRIASNVLPTCDSIPSARTSWNKMVIEHLHLLELFQVPLVAVQRPDGRSSCHHSWKSSRSLLRRFKMWHLSDSSLRPHCNLTPYVMLLITG